MFVSCTGIRTESVEVINLIKSRNAEELIRFSDPVPCDGLFTINPEEGLSEGDVIWLIETISSSIKGSLCIRTSRREYLRAALSVSTDKELFVELDLNTSGLEEIIPMLKKHNKLIIKLWETEELPGSVEESLSRIEDVTEFVKAYDLAPENIFLKPRDRAVNTDSDSSRLYLETLKHLKQDCYPEYGTFCPVNWNFPAGSPEETDSRILLIFLSGLGQDGIFLETDNNINAVSSVSKWIESINNFQISL